VGYSPILIFVLFVYVAHQGRCRRKCLIDKDKDCLFGRKVDSFANDVDELPNRQICRYKVLLLVNCRNVALIDLFANDLRACQSQIRGVCESILDVHDDQGAGEAIRADKTYWNTIVILDADAFSLGLTLLKRVLVLELATHLDGL